MGGERGREECAGEGERDEWSREALAYEYKYRQRVFMNVGGTDSCAGERTFDREVFAASRGMSERCKSGPRGRDRGRAPGRDGCRRKEAIAHSGVAGTQTRHDISLPPPPEASSWFAARLLGQEPVNVG